MIVLVLLSYTAIGYFEILPLKKNKETRKLVVYAIFFFVALVVSVMLSLGVKIPSPAIIMEKIVYSFTGQK